MTTTDNDSGKFLARELRAENKRLHAKIARLEAKIITLRNRTMALEKELKAGGKGQLAELLGQIMQRANRAHRA